MKKLNNYKSAKKAGRFCWSKLTTAFFCCLLFSVIFFLSSCEAKEENKTEFAKNGTEQSVEPEGNQDNDELDKTEEISGDAVTKEPVFLETAAEFKITKAELEKFKNSISFKKSNPKPAAHQKYLKDELIFKEVPNPNFDTDKSAVVGSFVCKFYPNVELKLKEDVKNLTGGIEVPFATLLPIYGEPVKVENAYKDEEYYDEIDFFKFEDNYNWFYRTKWQGQDGLVFGADLTGIDFSTDKNRLISLQYASKGASKEFYPIHRYNYLADDVRERLVKDRLAFQKVDYSEYSLSSEDPDDMLSLYMGHLNSGDMFSYSKVNHEPIFITTDLMAHARHIIFDRTLQFTEEYFFFPKMWELTQAFLKELEKVNAADSAITANKETLEKAKLYFQIANALCELAPTMADGKDEHNSPIKIYKEDKPEEVLKKYSKTIQEEIKLINEASDTLRSPLFSFADGSYALEDYTQYKPRGHYTKNKVLAAYFKAMMWFGRTNFLIANSDAEQLTYNMEPIALLITELVKNNRNLYNKWAELFDPITDLIGLSDDLSFKEILPLWNNYAVKDFKEWSSEKKNILAFMEEAHKKLKPPAIADRSVLYMPSEGDGILNKKPPMGWRLFGQRFVFDSNIHYQVSSPRLYGRVMVKGLDIMTGLGSKTADNYLAEDYKDFPQLKEILGKIKKEIEDSPEAALSKTYYGTVLNEIALQAGFEKGSGFFFTESDAWNKKALLSAHGTWAELRHDTILYAKQAYAEMGSGCDDSPTFRTEPIPSPVHYIEPNLAYWGNALVSTKLLENTLKTYGLINEMIADQLSQLAKICEDAVRIVKLEIEDKEVSQDDIDAIAGMPYKLARLVLIGMDSSIAYIEKKDLQMALVADVFTNGEIKQVLEIATGIPYRIYVPLNDKQGGKRIAVGYCFNYYEFIQPASNRLNNEQWKGKVYSEEKQNLEDLKPEWARNIALPPKNAE